MGIFDETQDYGGKWVRKFDQNEDPFIEKHLDEVPLLYWGVCVGFSLNWLEFKHECPEEIYPENTINEYPQTYKIIETQKYARYKAKPLAEILNLFGLQEIPAEGNPTLFTPGI